MTYSEREREFTTSRSLISSKLQIYVRGARSRLSLRARRDHDPALCLRCQNSLNHTIGLYVCSFLTPNFVVVSLGVFHQISTLKRGTPVESRDLTIKSQ